jgi:hypothetical protein
MPELPDENGDLWIDRTYKKIKRLIKWRKK